MSSIYREYCREAANHALYESTCYWFHGGQAMIDTVFPTSAAGTERGGHNTPASILSGLRGSTLLENLGNAYNALGERGIRWQRAANKSDARPPPSVEYLTTSSSLHASGFVKAVTCICYLVLGPQEFMLKSMREV